MKVLFLMIAYPDVARNTNMYTDLTLEFVRKGHEVFVAAPHSSENKIVMESGVRVLRIKTLPLFNTSIIKKGIANLLLPSQYKRAISKYFRNISFDLIVTPTPPITFLETARYFKKRDGSKLYLILRDIFPQNAKDLGLIKNSLIYRYFRIKEKNLYRIADFVGCMSQKNIDFVHKHNQEVDIKKFHLLPNWQSTRQNYVKFAGAKTKFNLNDKFVAVFGGNFGIPQKIEFIIEVAEKIRDNKQIVFLFIGDGTEKSKIKKMVSSKNLENVHILDPLPREEYLQLLSECDIGLVNLSDKFTIPNIPSRTLSYWGLKIPVLAAIDKYTDYGEMLDGCHGGFWSLTGDVDAYISNLMTLFYESETRKQMGENGYQYLLKELNPEKAYNTILTEISRK